MQYLIKIKHKLKLLEKLLKMLKTHENHVTQNFARNPKIIVKITTTIKKAMKNAKKCKNACLLRI